MNNQEFYNKHTWKISLLAIIISIASMLIKCKKEELPSSNNNLKEQSDDRHNKSSYTQPK